MRIGTSRADKLGFIVFTLMAALLAVLLIVSAGNGSTDVADSDQQGEQVVAGSGQVQGFAAAAADTGPLETTAPIPMPTEEPNLLPQADPVPLNAPVSAMAATDAADDEGDDAGSSDAASASSDNGGSTTESAAAPAAAPASDAQAAAPAAEVPNPQPQETTVPNPQPKETEVPNPQPGPAADSGPITPPPAAPSGGTFTHTLTATVSRPTLYNAPGGSAFTPTFNGQSLPAVNPTVFGNPLVYRVLAGTPDDGSGWAQVLVPARPNGTTAWVNTSEFQWGSSNRMIRINVSDNSVTVFEGGNVLLSTAAVTGKGSSPTPLANGWVEETMAGPSSAYGPRLISLGIFSNALNSFGGGVPKIALHGTNNPGLMGQYASNGCIRVPNDIINQIASMMPAGSKVEIVG